MHAAGGWPCASNACLARVAGFAVPRQPYRTSISLTADVSPGKSRGPSAQRRRDREAGDGPAFTSRSLRLVFAHIRACSRRAPQKGSHTRTQSQQRPIIRAHCPSIRRRSYVRTPACHDHSAQSEPWLIERSLPLGAEDLDDRLEGEPLGDVLAGAEHLAELGARELLGLEALLLGVLGRDVLEVGLVAGADEVE